MGTQVVVFALVGGCCTAGYAVLYLLLRGVLEPFWANATALVATAVVNTAANRRFTFGVRGRANALRHQMQGLAIFAAELAATTASLWLLHAATRHPVRSPRCWF